METPPSDAAAAASSASTIVTSSGSGSAAGSGPATADNSASSFIRRQRFSLNLPPGFHFAPTEAELVVHFLRPKLAGNVKLPLPIFFDERILDYHPEQLVEKYREHGEDRWFFFTRRELKFAGGNRPNRTTLDNGHWNTTGSLRPIYTTEGELVGCVGTQVFYEASRKKKKEDAAESTDDGNGKTHWTIYEYDSLTSEAEFQAKRNGEGKIDELVLCTIQKKKHCEQSKEENQEVTPCTGNSEKKRRRVNNGKDQENSRVGGNIDSEKKSRQVGRKKGSTAVGAKRRKSKKEIAQEQEATTLHQYEQMEEPFGAEFVNTDPDMDMWHCSVTASTLPMSYQEMMLWPAVETQSYNAHANNVMHHHSFSQPMEFLTLPGPTLQENFPYEQHYFYPQHMQLMNTMAPPEVYGGPGLGPEYSNYAYINGDHLLGTNMDYHEPSSFQYPQQPSYGAGGFHKHEGAVPSI